MDKSGKGEWILVVEDDEETAALLESLLVHDGYNVVVARDGEAGERLFANGKKFDLVFTDLGLPKIGGVELFHRIQSIRPSTKIIASSGYGHEKVIQQMIRDGVKAFVPKPYIPKDLLQIVRKILDE
jgi:two-component system response regulator YesN